MASKIRKWMMRLKDRVPMDLLFGTEAKEGATFDPKDAFEQAGGFYMTGERGQGTKYYSKNAKYVGNVDLLISILSCYKKGAEYKFRHDFLKNDPNGLKLMLKQLTESMDKQGETIEKIQEIVEHIKSMQTPQSEAGTQTNESSTAVVCEPNPNSSTGGCQHVPADINQIESGDTLGGKSSKDGKTIECKTEKKTKK